MVLVREVSRLKLSYNLNLEQNQKLIMTPELRQAIQLLQYNSLELNEYLTKEVEENPMLELDNTSQENETIEIDDKESEIDWKEYIERYDDISYKVEVDKNIKSHNLESYISYNISLKDYLISQLNMLSLNAAEKKLAEYIIQNVDNNGYLVSSIEEISQLTKTNINQVENILKIVQTFEPNGVGARDLKECLLLQIKEDDNPLIEDFISNHLEDIANNKIVKVAKEKGLDLFEVQNICDYIKTLEPKPGRTFTGNSEDVRYIIPDATIQYVEGEYIIIINDYTCPSLSINNFYKNILKNSVDSKTTEFLQEKFNSAVWIIKSIEQRKQTIYKVVESILKFQLEFFKKGESALIPLTLKDIADDIKMHESTISRATNGKYVQTPRGLYELKYFFTSRLAGFEGDISSTSIKATIKEIIASENTKKPLSDQQISETLIKKGYKISRRTIAKYRDELSIPASSLRKRY